MFNFGTVFQNEDDMQKTITAIIMLMLALVANAQVENTEAKIEGQAVENTATTDVPMQTLQADASSVRSMHPAEVADDTTSRRLLYLPRYAYGRPYLFSMGMPLTPFGWGGMWDVHEGLNAEVGMGVMVGFGKNNPFKGASFFSNVSLLYAKPVSKHWSVALGGTLSQFRMWNKNEFAGNVFALGNYKFDEHWSASIYGSYNHMPGGMAWMDFYSTPDMMNFNENFARFGAEVTYKFNEKCAISVGVSGDVPVGNNNRPWMPQRGSKQGAMPGRESGSGMR